jgi:biopolymer transport protein TolR
MAMITSGGAARGRRRRGRRGGPIADINMTPFIDVMLVLLIIFMVTAPLLTAGVPLDLPRTGAGQLNIEKKPLTVSVNNRGEIFVMEEATPLDRLLAVLASKARDSFDERIYVRGDRAVPYGDVARVMSVITAAGYKRVALVTEQDKK